MLATHPQGVQVKGVVGAGAEEEVVGEEEEEEHRRQEQTLHGLLWTVSECVKDANCNLFTQILVGTSNGTDHFGLFRPEYSGPAFKMVPFDRSGHFGRSKCTFPFDQIVVPSTALLYPAYKNNNQTRGGLGRVCATGMYRSIGHVKFPKFQTAIFVVWKVPRNSLNRAFQIEL